MNATKHPPLCRYCGGAIPKRTVALMCYAEPPRTTYTDHRTGQERPIAVHRHVVGTFKTKAELQRMVNERVVSIRKNADGTINFASTWDGQSYASDYFCNGKHATLFAYVMAAAGQQTTAYAKAAKVKAGTITLTLTSHQAAKVLDALAGPSATDPGLMVVSQHIALRTAMGGKERQ